MATQRLNDFHALAHIDFEVRTPGDEIHLVKIVGPHAHPQQPMNERLHHLGVIVHALQQYALVAKRHARKTQPRAGIAQLGGGLFRMVDVDAHPDRPVLLENLAQLRRDALRQERRNARANANKLHMLDRPQTSEQVVELPVGKQQRIAARQQHIADFRMRLDVAQPLLVFRVEVVVLRVGNEPAARAVTTVSRAPVRHEKQHPVRITMNQTRHRRVFVFAERIEHFFGVKLRLARTRNHLQPDGTVGIITINQVKKIRGDRHRQLVAREEHPGALVRRERHVALEVLQLGQAVFELPAPVIPIACGNVLPMSLAFKPGGTVFGVSHVVGFEVR